MPVVTRRQLLLLYTVAAAVRVAYVVVADPVVRPISDGRNYHLLANNLADGRGFIAPYDWAFLREARPTAEFMPLHPAVLALASFAGVDTVFGHQVWLGLVGALTPVVTALLAARVLGDRRLALAAGGVAAVHPLLLGSDGALMPETLFTLLVAGALLALLGAGRRATAAAGVLLGAAVLTRGDGLLVLAVVAVPLVALRHRGRELAVRLGLVLGLAALVVAPWVARNAVRFDGHLVLSNNLGSLLNGANCPTTYRGELLGSWDFTCADRVDLDRLDEVASSAAMRRAGIRHALDHPDRWPAVAAARLGRAWGLHELGEQAASEGREGRRRGVQVGAMVVDWALVPAFVAGAVALRRRGRPIAPLLAPVGAGVLLVLVAYGNSRFRQVAEPALITGAVAGVGLTRRRRTALTEHS